MASHRERTWKLTALKLLISRESSSVIICCFCFSIWEVLPVELITVWGQSRRQTVATQAERISRSGTDCAEAGVAASNRSASSETIV